MSDRAAAPIDGSVGRSLGGPGLYSASLDASKLSGAEFSAKGASVGRNGVVSLDGLGKLALESGAKTVPVNMTMASWRRASAAGLIAPSGSGGSGHGRASGGGSVGLGVVIDLTDFRRLAFDLSATAVAIKRGNTIISQAINHGLRKLNTQLKYKIKDWTGIQRVGEVSKGFSFGWSSPASMTGKLTIKDYHRALTAANFGAKWSRKNPGATHKAWNRARLAPHTFMISPNGPIFRRVGTGRTPLKVLWGPNFAREVDRHKTEVQHMVDDAGRHVQREAERLLRVAVTGSGRRR